jgi:hypothetical protein
MSFALRIPVFDTDYEPRLERRHNSHERHEHIEHQESGDSLERLPGQMVNIAGAAMIGSMGIGLMGMMLKK